MPDRYSDPFFTKRYKRYEEWNRRSNLPSSTLWLWAGAILIILVLAYDRYGHSLGLGDPRYWALPPLVILLLWNMFRRMRPRRK